MPSPQLNGNLKKWLLIVGLIISFFGGLGGIVAYVTLPQRVDAVEADVVSLKADVKEIRTEQLEQTKVLYEIRGEVKRGPNE